MNTLEKIFLSSYLGEFRRLALQAAAKQKDPFDWADTKIDDIDAKHHAKIFELANKETWFAEFFGAEPAATVHIAWLQDMRSMILHRWLVAEVVAAYAATPRVDPAAFAAAFRDRASVSYHDALYDLTEPKTWAQMFATAELDAVYLEGLRVAFDAILGEEEETAPAAAAVPAAESKPAAKKR